jgi:hypothetical protein
MEGYGWKSFLSKELGLGRGRNPSPSPKLDVLLLGFEAEVNCGMEAGWKL